MRRSPNCDLLRLNALALMWLFLVPSSVSTIVPYGQADTALFLAEFDTLIADSYGERLPTGLRDACRALGSSSSGDGGSLPSVSVAAGVEVSAASLMATCGTASICTVPAGSTLRMSGSVNVAALVVQGSVVWTDETQRVEDQWLCAGYVAVEAGATFNLTVAAARAWVYIKDNGAGHTALGARAFGGIRGHVSVQGRPLERTFSLLAAAAAAGATTIALLHEPAAMGWQGISLRAASRTLSPLHARIVSAQTRVLAYLLRSSRRPHRHRADDDSLRGDGGRAHNRRLRPVVG